MVCDNLGAPALALNPVYHSRTKHIDIDVHFIRDLIPQGMLDVRYVPIEEQPADLITKTVCFDRFQALSYKLTMSLILTVQL